MRGFNFFYQNFIASTMNFSREYQYLSDSGKIANHYRRIDFCDCNLIGKLASEPYFCTKKIITVLNHYHVFSRKKIPQPCRRRHL